jgi:hypothetical protein
MPRSSVDLAVALRSVSIHRMNAARRVRRLQKNEEKSLKVLMEQSNLDSYLMLISHNVNQLRVAFRNIKKLEKNALARREREKHPQNKMAGRNQGGFQNRQ